MHPACAGNHGPSRPAQPGMIRAAAQWRFACSRRRPGWGAWHAGDSLGQDGGVGSGRRFSNGSVVSEGSR